MSPFPDKPFSGRWALVTGASRGIGAAIARALAEAGANIALHYAANADAAERTAGVLRAQGVQVRLVPADLTDPAAPDTIAGQVAGLPVDMLVLNASVQTRADWRRLDPAVLETHVRVNFTAGFRLCQLFLPAMEQRGWGRLLAIGSVQERRPHPEMTAYAATKHAQAGLVLSLARQLAPSGVTANVLSPGTIATDRNRDALSDPAYADKVRAMIPAGRTGVPADCAGLARFLCSDEASYITGQIFYVDGGMGLA
jgi:glucose 1-dehydrogenase